MTKVFSKHVYLQYQLTAHLRADSNWCHFINVKWYQSLNVAVAIATCIPRVLQPDKVPSTLSFRQMYMPASHWCLVYRLQFMHNHHTIWTLTIVQNLEKRMTIFKHIWKYSFEAETFQNCFTKYYKFHEIFQVSFLLE